MWFIILPIIGGAIGLLIDHLQDQRHAKELHSNDQSTRLAEKIIRDAWEQSGMRSGQRLAAGFTGIALGTAAAFAYAAWLL